jgi:hypothetical protein
VQATARERVYSTSNVLGAPCLTSLVKLSFNLCEVGHRQNKRRQGSKPANHTPKHKTPKGEPSGVSSHGKTQIPRRKTGFAPQRFTLSQSRNGESEGKNGLSPPETENLDHPAQKPKPSRGCKRNQELFPVRISPRFGVISRPL